METLELEFSEPRKVRRADPVTKYDYCKIIASITKRPIELFLKETKAWPMEWLYQISSECKQLKDETAKAKFINWFIRESRLKIKI